MTAPVDFERAVAGMTRRAFVGGSAAAAALLDPAAARTVDTDLLREAFFYAYAPFEMSRLAFLATRRPEGTPPAYNRLALRKTLADHTARAVTTPNNDTLYASAWLDLAGGPLVFESITDGSRYFSAAFLDLFTDVQHVVGVRERNWGTGRFWVVGPAFEGSGPDDCTLIRLPTNDAWLLIRVLVDGPHDLDAAAAALESFRLTPVGTVLPARRVTPSDAVDPENLLAVTNEALGRSRPMSPGVARARAFEKAGLSARSKASWKNLDVGLQALWRETAPAALQDLKGAVAAYGARSNGWIVSPRTVGRFGGDDRQRAAFALGGIGGLTAEEAMYCTAIEDVEGARLDGRNRYRWRAPAGVPARAFWSLTLYEMDADGRLFFVDNRLRRYSVGDRTGLRNEADGSTVVEISASAPADARNWLPAPPGPFRLMLRLYVPGTEILSGAWTPPPVDRL